MSTESYPEQLPLWGVPSNKPKTLEERLKEAQKIKANLQAKINAKKQDPQPPNNTNKKGGKRKTHKRKGRKRMTKKHGRK